MDLSPYVAQLRKDLASAASAGDEETKRAATLLAGAVEPAIRLALMNALSDLAAEVTSNLDDHVVDLRISGRDVTVVVTPVGGPPRESTEHPKSAPPPPPPPPPAEGDISRITLRLFDEIKSKAEQAAATQGVSLNSWVAQAVQGALNGPWSGHGHRGGPRARGERPGGHEDQRGSGRDRDGDGGVHGWVQG
ncbi:toxin-antitoxin system HicB family antitoxin [Actinoalloteichus spitiensis]|uniref:toxin-antitoxin system HicB family antitoxin n=1 Tax=Actinoalloteichus spitiensis TaxID=252394 RepID=UPI00035EB96E|nr:toxin-antitoxin system HicB family antitoxin [Actinoalloteichus spitiensis]